MPRKKRAPWIKVYCDYTTSPSHTELDDRNLWTGVALMQLIRAGCDARGDREPWALQEGGAPCTVAGIARHAKQPADIARRGLAKLVSAGTVAIREDGAFGIPNFWSFQETPDAERKRTKGRTKGGLSALSPVDVPAQEVRGSSLRSDPPNPPGGDRGESEPALGAQSLANASPTASPAKPEPADPHREAAKRVLDRLSEHRVRLVQNARPYKHTDTNLSTILARLREGEPESDLLLVVDHEAAKVARGSDSKWLNPTTPFRPGNWPTRLADAQAAQASQPRRVVPIRREPDQFDRDIEEARAAVEAERRAKEAADASG